MKRRGITLIELLVAMSVFVSTMAAVLGIYVMARNAHEKGTTQSEAYKAVFVVLEKVENSLRGAQLLIPIDWESHVPTGSTTSITYLYPSFSGGRILVDPTGTPLWAGRARIELSTGGKVLRVDETSGLNDLIGNLGPGGTISFLRTERDLLQVTALSARTDNQSDTDSSYEFTLTLRLNNQP